MKEKALPDEGLEKEELQLIGFFSEGNLGLETHWSITKVVLMLSIAIVAQKHTIGKLIICLTLNM